VAQLSAPFAPFFSDWLFRNLTQSINNQNNNLAEGLNVDSLHLSILQKADLSAINIELEEKMGYAQEISSMILSVRKKENIRVRQPLQAIRIPVLDNFVRNKIDAVKDIILAETNVKTLEFVDETQARIVKDLKLNFKTLGKKCGKHMKALQVFAADNPQQIISAIETNGVYNFVIEDIEIELNREDVDIIPVDIPGWKVLNDGHITVALDISISEELKQEGIAREFVNRIQNLRKDLGFDVTDKISVKILKHDAFDHALRTNSEYIRAQILAGELILSETVENGHSVEIEDGISTLISLIKLN
jgi:isoleucyl-tRNA synthetase